MKTVEQAPELVAEGESLLNEERFEEAMNHFRHCLEQYPTDLKILSYINLLETVLLHRYLGRFPLQLNPRINPEISDRLTQLNLQSHEGYLLTQIDGRTSVKSLIYICGLGKFLTLRTLNTFLDDNIIVIAP